MITAAGMTAVKAEARRRVLSSFPSSFTSSSTIGTVVSRRCLGSSSSAFIDIPPLPEAVKEAVKSTVLDEATRPDSKLWTDRTKKGENPRTVVNGMHGPSHVNGTATTTDDLVSRPLRSYDDEAGSPKEYSERDRQLNGHRGHVNGSTTTPHSAVGGNINNPISSTRLLLLNDPLDEWHLNAKPTRALHSLPHGVRDLEDGADPFVLAKSDMETLSEDIRRDLIGSDHPVLTKAASYFFERGQEGGKKVRPMMVMLMSRALALTFHPHAASDMDNATSPQQAVLQPLPWQRSDLPTSQRRLAEISEMIHTASLFHDDVIDGADTRRNAPSVHKVFGNKMAILAGDYLLARASIYLARLRDVEVVETMSTIIEHLVRGEVMQLKGAGADDAGAEIADSNVAVNERLLYYLRKNFYKTASLMANSCKSAAILGSYPDEYVNAAYRYGKHVGIAFQLVDDVLDFEGNTDSLGKPALADLNAGIATAPVLFASELYPNEMETLMGRKFRIDGDVERAVELVRETNGLERTKDLARVHVDLAIDAIMELGGSSYRDSLVHLAYKVVDRTR